MAFVLSIETSTTVCSAALFNDKNLLILKEEDGAYSHAEKLAVFIEEIFNESQISSAELSAVAVSKGPGSYTGLRIGVSLAKGMCFALNIPLISIDTLQSMAWAAKQKLDEPGLLSPMIDARRMEVYTALFDIDMHPLNKVDSIIIDETFLMDRVKEGVVFLFGNGVEKTLPILTHENFVYLNNILPSASNLGVLAFDKYVKGEFVDVAYFEPFYLKEFIALKGKKLV